jgi:hypothetical protein
VALDYEALVAELRDVMAAQWPLVVKGDGGRKIFEARQIKGQPLDQLVAIHGLPYAVIDFQSVASFPMGLANRCYALETELLYVAEAASGAEGVRPLLESMALYLATTGLTTGKVWDDPDPEPDWGEDLLENETLENKKIEAIAGVVRLVILMTETK